MLSCCLAACLAARFPWAPRLAPGWPDNVILYDGVCVLCSSWVRFIIARDEACRFRFIELQRPQGRALAEALGIDPDDPETNAVILDGTAYYKSDAALVAARHLRGMKWVVILKLIPRRLRNWLYDRIARNRYTLFGRFDRCLRPTPDLAARFLDDLGQACNG
jgi:predicted DCC family thiol-disulfide oxidoreductase YuxK